MSFIEHSPDLGSRSDFNKSFGDADIISQVESLPCLQLLANTDISVDSNNTGASSGTTTTSSSSNSGCNLMSDVGGGAAVGAGGLSMTDTTATCTTMTSNASGNNLNMDSMDSIHDNNNNNSNSNSVPPSPNAQHHHNHHNANTNNRRRSSRLLIDDTLLLAAQKKKSSHHHLISPRASSFTSSLDRSTPNEELTLNRLRFSSLDLYGREEEVTRLRDAYSRVRKNVAMSKRRRTGSTVNPGTVGGVVCKTKNELSSSITSSTSSNSASTTKAGSSMLSGGVLTSSGPADLRRRINRTLSASSVAANVIVGGSAGTSGSGPDVPTPGVYPHQPHHTSVSTSTTSITSSTTAASSSYSPEFLLLAGVAGSGKSALALQLRKPARRTGGFFVSGKFDPNQRSEPYSAFVPAFSELCHAIVKSNNFGEMAADVRSALGTEADALTVVIPDLHEVLCGGLPGVSGGGGGGVGKKGDTATSPSTPTTTPEDDILCGNDSIGVFDDDIAIMPTLSANSSGSGPWCLPESGVNNTASNISSGSSTRSASSVGLVEARNRFNFLFRQFTRAICSRRPMVLFLDDLQWADAASLDLLETLVTDRGNPGLLVVGAYRDNEVNDSHPLSNRLRKIEACYCGANNGVIVSSTPDGMGGVQSGVVTTSNTVAGGGGYLQANTIRVTNLDVDTVNRFLADVLSTSVIKTKSLADIVHEKTHGNAFFVVQFLHSLRDEGLLTYNLMSLRWNWDEDTIRSGTSVTDNVADLMRDKMQKRLMPDVLFLLRIAACIGSTVEASTMVVVADGMERREGIVDSDNDGSSGSRSNSFVHMDDPNYPHQSDNITDHNAAAIAAALSANGAGPIVDDIDDYEDGEYVIQRTHNEKEFFDRLGAKVIANLDKCVDEGLLTKDESRTKYRFVHDEIQHAAFSLTPPGPELDNLQLQIGEILVERLPPNEFERVLFVAVDLLNCGYSGSLLPPLTEKTVELSSLNLRAGKKAMESAAFVPAVIYLKNSLALLGVNHWDDHYELTLEVLSSLAECEFCNGKLDNARIYAGEILSREDVPFEDKFRAYLIQIKALGSGHKLLEAIGLCRDVMNHIGITLPRRNALNGAVISSVVKTKMLLRDRSVTSVSDLPVMRDEDKLRGMKILHDLCTYAFAAVPFLVPLAVLKMVRWSVQYGVCKYSSMAFAFYGVINCGVLGDLKSGHEFGKVALSLVTRFNAREMQSRVLFITATGINHWVTPLQLTLKPLLQSYEIGMETGDVENAMIGIHNYCKNALVSGRSMSAVEEDMRAYSQQMKDYKQEFTLLMLAPVWQFTLNILGHTRNPMILSGEAMDLDEMMDICDDSQNLHVKTLVNGYQMWLAFYFGDYERSWKMALESRCAPKTLFGSYELWRYTFFEGLTAFALAHKHKAHRKRWQRRALHCMKKLKKWTKSGNVNCTYMIDLFEAENAALYGKTDEAQNKYNLAISTSARYGVVQDRALANELAGESFIRMGDRYWAAHYLGLAHQFYKEWGAHAKAAHLRKKHYYLFTGDLASMVTDGDETPFRRHTD